jgi:hypothetical protein
MRSATPRALRGGVRPMSIVYATTRSTREQVSDPQSTSPQHPQPPRVWTPRSLLYIVRLDRYEPYDPSRHRAWACLARAVRVPCLVGKAEFQAGGSAPVLPISTGPFLSRQFPAGWAC